MRTYSLILFPRIVQGGTEVAPDDLLFRVQLDCFLVGFGCVVKPAEAKVSGPQVNVSGIARPDGDGFHQRVDGLVVLPHFEIDGADVHVGPVPVRSDLDGFGIHLQGLIVFVATTVKGADHVIAVAAVGMGLNGLLISLFRFSDLAFMFVRQGQTDGGFFVGWFETEGQLVFGGSFWVMSSAVVDEAEADVTGGTGIPELDGIVASAL